MHYLQEVNKLRSTAVRLVSHLAQVPSSAVHFKDVLLSMPVTHRQQFQVSYFFFFFFLCAYIAHFRKIRLHNGVKWLVFILSYFVYWVAIKDWYFVGVPCLLSLKLTSLVMSFCKKGEY